MERYSVEIPDGLDELPEPPTILRGKKGTNMGMTLYEHNRIAYEASVQMLKDTGKAAVTDAGGGSDQ